MKALIGTWSKFIYKGGIFQQGMFDSQRVFKMTTTIYNILKPNKTWWSKKKAKKKQELDQDWRFFLLQEMGISPLDGCPVLGSSHSGITYIDTLW